jgi:hypothetical protein
MHNNPAFIKWYVTVVQSAKRPEDVLIDPKLFLDYCLENVFNHLTPLEKNICKAMTAVPGEHSQAMLAFICDMEISELQNSLHKLLSTNLLKMTARNAGEEIDTVYELTDLARFYIVNNVPMSEMEKRHFNSKRQSVAEIYDRYAWRDKYIYNPNFVVVKSRDEAVVARKPIEALTASRKRDYPRCFSIIEEAKNLSPSYHEVYRVEGWTRSMFGDYVGAAEAYETALRIHAKSRCCDFSMVDICCDAQMIRRAPSDNIARPWPWTRSP